MSCSCKAFFEKVLFHLLLFDYCLSITHNHIIFFSDVDGFPETKPSFRKEKLQEVEKDKGDRCGVMEGLRPRPVQPVRG